MKPQQTLQSSLSKSGDDSVARAASGPSGIKDLTPDAVSVLVEASDIAICPTEIEKRGAWHASDPLLWVFFNSPSIGMVQLDLLTGGLCYVNRRFCELVGFEEEELLGRSFLDVTHSDHRARDINGCHQLLRGEILEYQTEKRYVRKDRSVTWVQVTAKAIPDGKNPSRYGIAIIQEITRQKVAENEVKRMQQILLEGERIAHLGSWEYIVDTQETVWSDEEKRIFGLDPTEPSPVYEEMLRTHIYSEDAAELDRCFRKALSGNMPFEKETRIVLSDGSIRWISNRAHPYFDDTGILVKYIGVSLDITERKRTEAALCEANELLEERVIRRTAQLYESEQRLRLAQEAGNIGVFDWDIRLGKVTCSAALELILKDPMSGVADPLNHWTRFLHPSDLEAVQREIERVLKYPNEPYMLEHRVVQSDGCERWILVRANIIHDDSGNPTRVVGITMDVSERKQAEIALLQSNQRLKAIGKELQEAEERARAQLSRELHDEFGQVLSGLKLELANANTLLMNRGDLRQIAVKIKGANDMTDSLFTSLRAMVMNLRPSVLGELGLGEAVKTLAADLALRGDLKFHVLVNMPNFPYCNEWNVNLAVFRITQELLTNVVCHAKASTVTVALNSTATEIILKVQDNGQGFDVQQKVTRSQFGLCGVHERAELLGGTVTVMSNPDEGTTITVKIPVELFQLKAPAIGKEGGRIKQKEISYDN